MHPLDTRTINALSASMMVEELIRNGVDCFCLAPGSRCSPLTLVVARHPRARVFKHFDERGLGFFALGLARGSGQPAVVITTSGTAVANLLPAVVEADLENIPLIILSADRPPELRATAANQTIDQVNIFGARTRWFVDLPCPCTQAGPEYLLHTIDHAVDQSRQGPVHLNAMLREPLVPLEQGPSLTPWLCRVQHWVDGADPFTRYIPTERTPCESYTKELAASLSESPNGILVVGELSCEADRSSACTLGEILRWPIVADLRSGLRSGNPSLNIIHQMDVILQHPEARGDAPGAIIHLGGRLLSKRVQEWINQHAPSVYILCQDAQQQIVPGHVTHRAAGSVQTFCENLARTVKPAAEPGWLERWQARQTTCDTVLTEHLSSVLNEPAVARAISRQVPAGHLVFLGNSMPVRDMDMFASPDGQAAGFHANRGASGIDGLAASAAGVATGAGQALTLLIGDLSLLHDLNSLPLLRDARSPVTIVVINNDGGGIFSFLPIAEQEEVFEEYFGTPHGCSFEHAAAQFGIAYTQVTSLERLIKTYAQAVTQPTSTLIEVITQRDTNLADHQAIRDAVIERLDA
jgi:2-succinyl-5-enolpyruvyl-6-hydroxy-3-cyclohexene-1-carboxylate synthase